MKIRTGFVSNSSSSSFICVMGKIVDEAKFNEYSRTSKASKLLTVCSLDEAENIVNCGDFFDRVSLPENLDENAKYVAYSGGYEDDYAFWNEETEEYNYDIDLDFFDDDQQEVYCIGPDQGVEIIEQTYYAGRDG